MPLSKRDWWIVRIQKELNKSSEQGAAPQAPKGAAPNQDQTQNALKRFEAMLGK